MEPEVSVRRNILLKGKMTNEMYVEGFRLMAKK